MKLNKSELISGAIVGACSAPIVGLWWLALSPICAVLWAMGGAEKSSKLYRRLGVPAVLSISVALVNHSWLALTSIPLAFAVLSLGYGIPTTQPVDEGSWLGRICFDLAKKNEKLAELYCRTIIYTLLALAFIPCWVAK